MLKSIFVIFFIVQHSADASGLTLTCSTAGDPNAPYAVTVYDAENISKKSKVLFSSASLGGFPVNGLKLRYAYNDQDEEVVRLSGTATLHRRAFSATVKMSLEVPVQATEQKGETLGWLKYSFTDKTLGKGEVQAECETD